jgi:hypothetical protein
MRKIAMNENLRTELIECVNSLKLGQIDFHDFKNIVINILINYNWEIIYSECSRILKISASTLYHWKKKHDQKKDDKKNACTVLKFEYIEDDINNENLVIEKKEILKITNQSFSRMHLPSGIILDIDNTVITPEFIKGLLQ